jgi:predicted NBD/HSP70 family sugar kinase
LIRDGEAVTRAALTARTGLSRSTVSQRVDALLAHGLVYEADDSVSTGGRRPGRLAFDHRAGGVLTADLGATHSRLAVSDLAATTLAAVELEMDIAIGPERALRLVCDQWDALLDETDEPRGGIRGIGVGLPGPVDHTAGQAVNPPIMPGWDGFPVRDWLNTRYRVPVLVDNDVNIMALGEHRKTWRQTQHLLYVKVGTGIGCGIVSGGQIHRGAEGAAGDIGHIVVPDHQELCRCGNVGCLEAVAGGRALAMRLAAEGYPAADSRDVVRLVNEGNAVAIRIVREAGRTIGEVLAACVNFFNPGVILIGGDMAAAHGQLLAGVREVIFQRSLPLATRNLSIAPSQLADGAGVVGAAIMVVEHLLAPAAIDRALRASA